MKLTRDSINKRWVVTDLEEFLMPILQKQGIAPYYYDNTKNGDIFMYNDNVPLGKLIDYYIHNGYNLEVIY